MIHKLRYFSERTFHKLVPGRFRPHLIHYARLFFIRAQRLIIHRGRDLPVAVCIEPNSTCTRNCGYCPRPQRTTEMETELFHSVINQLKDWGFKGRISPHSYNEPLTDKRIFDLIAYTSKTLPKSEIVVYTNGDLLTEEVVKKLKEVGTSEIKITLHEPSSEELVGRIDRLRKKYKMVTLIDLRADYRTQPLSNRGGLVSLKNTTEKYPSCYNIELMVIRATGNIILCCQDVKEEYVFGNVKEKSVESIWNSPKYSNVRSAIRKKKFSLPICQQCACEQL